MHFHSTNLLLLLGTVAPSLSAIIDRESGVKIDVQINTADDSIPAGHKTTIAGDKDVSTADINGVDTIDSPFQLTIPHFPGHAGAGEAIGPGFAFSLLDSDQNSTPFYLIQGVLRSGDQIVARSMVEEPSLRPKALFVMHETAMHHPVLWKAVVRDGERHLVLAKHGANVDIFEKHPGAHVYFPLTGFGNTPLIIQNDIAASSSRDEKALLTAQTELK